MGGQPRRRWSKDRKGAPEHGRAWASEQGHSHCQEGRRDEWVWPPAVCGLPAEQLRTFVFDCSNPVTSGTVLSLSNHQNRGPRPHLHPQPHTCTDSHVQTCTRVHTPPPRALRLTRTHRARTPSYTDCMCTHTLTQTLLQTCTDTRSHTHTHTFALTCVHTHSHRLAHSCSAPLLFQSSEALCLVPLAHS